MTIFPAVDPERARRHRASGAWDGRLLDSWLDAAPPERTAVVDGSVRLSYAELADRVGRAAAGLRRLGVGRGDVVSMQLPNWWEALVVHLAAIRIGAVSNPLMPILREREMRYAVATAGTSVLVVASRFRGFDHGALALTLGVPHVVTVRGRGAFPFEDLLASADGGHAEPGRTPDDPVTLLYTSGTESDPKGAVHSHETLAYEDRSMIAHFGLTADDVVYMPSPVAHITGVLYGFHLATMLGSTVVYQDVWDPAAGAALVAREGATVTVAATPFLYGLAEQARTGHGGSSLRVFACGGADVPPDLVRDAAATLGCLVVRVYGSTEIPTLTAGHAADPPSLRAGTDGRVVGEAELQVVDDAGEPVPPDVVGHLLARGPEAFLGYLGRPPATGGWIHTGDRGSVDAAGYLTVTGRSKDIILRGGENISAKEVEDLLYGHPGIAAVAVVAMPDPRLVERACAVVVPYPGVTLALADLTTFLDGLAAEGQGIARQKYPERLEVVDALPATPTGKIQKFRLRELVAERMADRSRA